MPKSEVLFIVNGYGMGNSTRSHALMERLGLTHAHVATSGNGVSYFTNLVDPSVQIYSLWQAKYLNHFGFLSFIPTLLYFFSCGLVNSFKLTYLLLKVRPTVIIADSNYNLVARLWPFAKLVSINTSSWVLQESKRHALPKSIRKNLLIEIFEYYFNKVFSQLILVPSFDAKKNISLSLEKLKSQDGELEVGLLVRRAFLKPCHVGKQVSTVLILQSASSWGARDLKEQLRSTKCWKTLSKGKYVYSTGKNCERQMAGATYIVSQGGYSSLAECCALGKTVYAFPIKGHAEQHLNVLALKRSNQLSFVGP